MAWINVGATVNGARPKSKKTLKASITDNPGSVVFDSTALAGPRAGDTIRCEPADIGGDRLSVTGPDPYTARTWYATVQVSRSGKVQIT